MPRIGFASLLAAVVISGELPVLAAETKTAAEQEPAEVIAQRITTAARKVELGRNIVTRSQERVAPFAQKAAGAASTSSYQMREFDRHVRAAESVERKSASAQGVAARAHLKTALSEYREAERTGGEATVATRAQRAAEGELAEIVTLARTSADEVKRNAGEVATSLEALSGAAKRFAEDAKKAAGLAQKDAAGALGAAGLGSPQAQAAKREKDDRELEKLKAEVTAAERALREAGAEVGGKKGAPRAARPSISSRNP